MTPMNVMNNISSAPLTVHQTNVVKDDRFTERLQNLRNQVEQLFMEIYGSDSNAKNHLASVIEVIEKANKQRRNELKLRDEKKGNDWFLSNTLTGMSLYVDRFNNNLSGIASKIEYFKELGVNLLHLMPVMESPVEASDGGYAVSNFRKVDKRFGTNEDLGKLQQKLLSEKMYLMLDIVLNHTSDRHEWALNAKKGIRQYEEYYYCFADRQIPDQFEQSMPEIFPESSPGNFTYVNELNKWVMTVFHSYQWDLNYRNPMVFIEMLDTILYYANLGVDILRIDAPAFIWKQLGTTCQNLHEAHVLLRLLKLCVSIAAPGMALLGEAIVAPNEIMKYFGEGDYYGRECDFAYNATQMALQWDALATGDTRVMLAAQGEIAGKPMGTSWINYTRCHDDIGLGYSDEMIRSAGFNPFEHRKFIKDFYAGNHHYSTATGALFSVNPKTNDARISGTLASLCGLEKAVNGNNGYEIELSIKRILLIQAMSLFLGGLPMIFYGDEVGYTNDYGYLSDSSKSYDNRWMHRPIIKWEKNDLRIQEGTVQQKVFSATKKLIALRASLAAIGDRNNLTWLYPHNIHVAGFLRSNNDANIFCVFNFKNEESFLTWYAFREKMPSAAKLKDLWTGKEFTVGRDDEYLILQPYDFAILQVIQL